MCCCRKNGCLLELADLCSLVYWFWCSTLGVSIGHLLCVSLLCGICLPLFNFQEVTSSRSGEGCRLQGGKESFCARIVFPEIREKMGAPSYLRKTNSTGGEICTHVCIKHQTLNKIPAIVVEMPTTCVICLLAAAHDPPLTVVFSTEFCCLSGLSMFIWAATRKYGILGRPLLAATSLFLRASTPRAFLAFSIKPGQHAHENKTDVRVFLLFVCVCSSSLFKSKHHPAAHTTKRERMRRLEHANKRKMHLILSHPIPSAKESAQGHILLV